MNGTYLVIPAYNEEARLPGVVEELKKFFPLERVVVVDDGSKVEIKSFLPSKVRVARHVVNLGKGIALRTGCELAIELGAKKIVLMDGDGQHDPKEIPYFIKELDKKYKIIFGARKLGKDMPAWRMVGNQLLNKTVATLFGLELHDVWCGYRAFDTSVYPSIVWNAADYSSDVEMVVNVGLQKLKHKERYVGTIYHNKKSTTGTTLQDGLKLLLELFIWRIFKR
jgi:glycosyltransferase involved in cell wall biosynthesis